MPTAQRFDMDYYLKSHIPLVQKSLGESLKGVIVDEGISQPGSPAPFLAMENLLFDSVTDLQLALDAHGRQLMADIPTTQMLSRRSKSARSQCNCIAVASLPIG